MDGDRGCLIFNPTPTPAPRVQVRVLVAFRVYVSVMFQAVSLFFPDPRRFLVPFLLSFFFFAVAPAQIRTNCDFSLLLSLPILPTACQASY